MINNLTIVIFANSKDYFFTKILVSSIRYYYPDIPIELVKDSLNGSFNSKTLEKKFNVKEIKLSKKYFGWSAAKLHFLIELEIDKQYLCLDSDIIFVGKVLEKFKNSKADFIVSPEYFELTDNVKSVFVDPVKAKEYYPDYEFPGFFFNGGQTIVNPSKIKLSFFENIFNPEKYPYYINYEDFRYVDQSILNALLPSLHNSKTIKLQAIEFMQPSHSYFKETAKNDFLQLDSNENYLVHYAGDERNYSFNEMKGIEKLVFFRTKYESKLNKTEIVLSRMQDFCNNISIFTKMRLKKNRVLIEISKYL